MEEKKLHTIKIIYTVAGIIGIFVCLFTLWMNIQIVDFTDMDTLTWFAYIITPMFVAIIIIPFLMLEYKWRKNMISKRKVK